MAYRIFTDSEEQQIASIYISGKSTRAISRVYSCDKTAVVSALRRTNTVQRSPSERNRLYKLNPYVFDEIHAESAYWLGFIYADGYIFRNTLVVHLSYKDRDHLLKFRDFMESNTPIIKKHDKLGYEYARLEVSDARMINILRLMGIVTERTELEKTIKFVPSYLDHHFIRGLFDGDGSIDFHDNQPRLRICGGEDLVTYIADTLDEHGAILGKKIVYKHRTKNIYYFVKSGRNVVRSVVDFIYRDGGTHMERKYLLAQMV